MAETAATQPLVFRVGTGPWQMRVPMFISGTNAYTGSRDIVLPQELQAYYDAIERARSAN